MNYIQNRTLQVLATGLFLIVGCGDENDADEGSSTTEATTDNASTTSDGAGDGNSEEADSGSGGVDDSGDSGSPVNPDDVPAVRLAGDLANCPGEYADNAPVDGQNNNFESAGQTRNFFLSVPPDEFEGPRPIVIAFNGTGGDGESFARFIDLGRFAERGFISLSLSSNANGTLWPVWDAMRNEDQLDDPNPDMDFTDQALSCLAAHLEVDQNRIYVVGHSAGGIMANYVLQRRSNLLAGGIVASGVFSLTSPAGDAPLDDMFTLVTWGGDSDAFQGETKGVVVPEVNFVEQASLASIFYEEQANVGQINCVADIGHDWISDAQDWMIDRLIEHPKGLSGADGVEIAGVPNGVECNSTPFMFESGVTVSCEPGAVENCDAACQLFGDCIIANSTVGPVLGPQVIELGFSGEGSTECGGCVSRCDGIATEAADAEVLRCIADAQQSAMCGPGIEGAFPAIDTINRCCEDRSDSPYCVDVCTIIMGNDTASAFFPTCSAIVQG